MTGSELLEKRNVRFLFTQGNYNYYSCGCRFYKVQKTGFNLNKAIPVDLKERA